ncbi:hypothetical protein [Secundilactobacillus kimchicus]|uniref:hypothetical protein n=1 Tax=Secundilactobacillus kimchicus TaxID=528209 RepID=UPI0024A98A2C|nr:hypothetical protein [Secundilactobacillus kimchicus]
MFYGTYDLIRPLHFIQSGQFTCGIGWQHDRSTKKKDTEILIGTSKEIAVKVEGRPFTLKAGDCLTVFPSETIIGDAPAKAPASFIWLHFINQSSLSYGHDYPNQIENYTCVLPRFFRLNQPEKAIALAAQLLDITHSNSSIISDDYVTSLPVSELSNDYFHQINRRRPG